MISILKFTAGKIYYFLVELYFCFKTTIYADGIRIHPKTIDKINFLGNNSIGKDCQIFIDKQDKSKEVVRFGKNSWIRNNVEINIPKNSKLILGNKTTVQDFCRLVGDVWIGTNTLLAPGVFLSSGNHNAFFKPHLTIREQDSIVNKDKISAEPIFIEEDCWLGINSYVERGSYIGRGSIIGAGARVKGNIPPYSVIVGNNIPKNKRFDFVPPSELRNIKEHTPFFYRGFEEYNEELNAFCCSNEGLIVLEKKTDVDKIGLILGVSFRSTKGKFSGTVDIFYNGEKVECFHVSKDKKEVPLIISGQKTDKFDNILYPQVLVGFNVICIKVKCIGSDNITLNIKECKVLS